MFSSPVLVVAPHALDEVLGCAGVMALAAEAGRDVHVLVLCGDGTGLDARRREAAFKAASILGSKPPEFAGFPENRSDTIGLGQLIGAVEVAVKRIAPGSVYVSHGGNLNIDHQTAFRATATALRPMPGGSVAEFCAYEIPSSTDWATEGIGESFRPNRYVDIAPVMKKKSAALNAYGFDMRAQPHARSIAAVENLACRRGATVGLEAAEAFMVLRQIERR